MSAGATPEANERALVARWRLIADPQERLAAALDAAGVVLGQAERTPERLVPGCVSRVWLDCRLEGGVCRFACDAESPVVRGLARLVCAVYDGCEPEAVAGWETGLMAALGFDRQLSPTRLNGLASLAAAIRAFAAGVG